MPVPKQRLASRRGRTRAAHHALSKVATIECPACHQPTLPHRACPACGAYRGRNVRTVRAQQPAAETAVKPEAKPDAPVAPAEPTTAQS